MNALDKILILLTSNNAMRHLQYYVSDLVSDRS